MYDLSLYRIGRLKKIKKNLTPDQGAELFYKQSFLGIKFNIDWAISLNDLNLILHQRWLRNWDCIVPVTYAYQLWSIVLCVSMSGITGIHGELSENLKYARYHTIQAKKPTTFHHCIFMHVYLHLRKTINFVTFIKMANQFNNYTNISNFYTQKKLS